MSRTKKTADIVTAESAQTKPEFVKQYIVENTKPMKLPREMEAPEPILPTPPDSAMDTVVDEGYALNGDVVPDEEMRALRREFLAETGEDVEVNVSDPSPEEAETMEKVKAQEFAPLVSEDFLMIEGVSHVRDITRCHCRTQAHMLPRSCLHCGTRLHHQGVAGGNVFVCGACGREG